MGKVCRTIRRIGLLLGLVVALLPLTVFAQENSGSIHIEQLDTDTKKPVAGVKLSLYRIADSDDSGSYRLTSDFKKIGGNAEDFCSAEKCSSNVKLLDSFIEKNKPDAVTSKVTEKDGIIDFTGLTDGIYFVKQMNTKEDFQKLGYTYKTDSYLVILPWTTGEFTRNIICKPKGKTNYPEDRTKIVVYKVWKDNNDKAGRRPDSIKVGIYCDGKLQEKKTLSAANNWTCQWKNLDNSRKWKVKELDVPDGYTSEITSQESTYTITNTFTPTVTPGTSDTPNTPHTPGTSSKTGKSVKTGDTTNIAVYVVLFIGAAAVASGISIFRRKKNRK